MDFFAANPAELAAFAAALLATGAVAGDSVPSRGV